MSKDDDRGTTGAGSDGPDRDEDGWDDWADDDDWKGSSGGGGTDTRLIAVVLVAAVAIIATILFTRNDSGGDGASDSQEQVADEGGENAEGDDDEILDWPWAIGGQGGNIDDPGFYIWSDLEGIHLRSNIESPLTVVITADDPIVVKDAGAGVTASTTEGTEITFEFPADSDGSDGPDLDVSGFVTEFSVDARTDEGPIPLDRFHVGDSADADANPAIFRRGA